MTLLLRFWKKWQSTNVALLYLFVVSFLCTTIFFIFVTRAQKRKLLFFCTDCSLVTRNHSTVSWHTNQWPINQATWKGRTSGWQKMETCFHFNRRDKQWTSVWFFPQYLSTTYENAGEHSLVPDSVRKDNLYSVTTLYSAVKSKLCSLWR